MGGSGCRGRAVVKLTVLFWELRPTDLVAGGVVAFDHDFDGLVEVAGVVLALDLALAVLEDAEALGLDLVGDAVGHCDCGVLGRGRT